MRYCKNVACFLGKFRQKTLKTDAFSGGQMVEIGHSYMTFPPRKFTQDNKAGTF